MRPILPGFAGHVPPVFMKQFPTANVTKVTLLGISCVWVIEIFKHGAVIAKVAPSGDHELFSESCHQNSKHRDCLPLSTKQTESSFLPKAGVGARVWIDVLPGPDGPAVSHGDFIILFDVFPLLLAARSPLLRATAHVYARTLSYTYTHIHTIAHTCARSNLH
jgi:hypothetical protein